MLKNFEFTISVHPINGGDDYTGVLTITAKTRKDAEKKVIQYLRKRSTVIDYRFNKIIDLPNEEDNLKKYRLEWKQFASKYGFKIEDLGKEFDGFKGETYKIIGIQHKNRQKPIIIKRMRDGEIFKAPAEWVKQMLERRK